MATPTENFQTAKMVAEDIKRLNKLQEKLSEWSQSVGIDITINPFEGKTEDIDYLSRANDYLQSTLMIAMAQYQSIIETLNEAEREHITNGPDGLEQLLIRHKNRVENPYYRSLCGVEGVIKRIDDYSTRKEKEKKNSSKEVNIGKEIRVKTQQDELMKMRTELQNASIDCENKPFEQNDKQAVINVYRTNVTAAQFAISSRDLSGVGIGKDKGYSMSYTFYEKDPLTSKSLVKENKTLDEINSLEDANSMENIARLHYLNNGGERLRIVLNYILDLDRYIDMKQSDPDSHARMGRGFLWRKPSKLEEIDELRYQLVKMAYDGKDNSQGIDLDKAQKMIVNVINEVDSNKLRDTFKSVIKNQSKNNKVRNDFENDLHERMEALHKKPDKPGKKWW